MTMSMRWILGSGFAIGMMAATVVPSGCILPDYCIMLRTAGRDYCRFLEGAMMWPVGHPELAEPVMGAFGNPPKGCRCFNAAEQAILTNKTPSEKTVPKRRTPGLATRTTAVTRPVMTQVRALRRSTLVTPSSAMVELA